MGKKNNRRKLNPDAKCYLCGAPATSLDHIPPKGIFPRPLPAKTNLITVPACEKCNGGSKEDDHYFRICIIQAAALRGNPILIPCDSNCSHNACDEAQKPRLWSWTYRLKVGRADDCRETTKAPNVVPGTRWTTSQAHILIVVRRGRAERRAATATLPIRALSVVLSVVKLSSDVGLADIGGIHFGGI